MARTKLAQQTLAAANKEAHKAKIGQPDAAPPAEGSPSAAAGKKKRKRRNPKRWAQQCAKFQKQTDASRILPLAPTERWIRTITAEVTGKPSVRFSPDAINALRHVLIDYGTEVMADGFNWNVLNKEHTLTAKALKFADHLKRKAMQQYRVAAP